MFVLNDDLSIYATRGDIVHFMVSAKDDGKPYKFQPGDVVRMKIFGKKDAENVVMQKDFPVYSVTEKVEIYLTENDTKFGEIISKPRDYWYEVELNPLSDPKTIIGYDDDGAKVFKLFPEGADAEEYHPDPADFPVVDEELDLTSPRPVSNQAIAAAVASLNDKYDRNMDAVAALHVTPEMFGAIGDGEADDTEALQEAFDSCQNVVISNGSYMISDTLNLASNTVVTITNATIKSTATANKKYIFNIEGEDNIKIFGDNATLEMAKPETAQQACIAIFNAQNILVDGFVLTKAGGDGIIIGGATSKVTQDVIINNCVIDNSRRNGISIVGGVDNIKIHNCVIKNTSGTEPQLGIDIETWSADLMNKNIEVSGCRFENNTNGSMTIFEYTDGVKVHDNYFEDSFNVKVNNDYATTTAAIPTNIEAYNNTFKTSVYLYRISDGAFSFIGNVFDGCHITLEHSESLNSETAIKNAKAKTIANNIFNNCGTALYIGNNANISVMGNVINNCTYFLNLLGVTDCVVSNNIVNGYNSNGECTCCISMNGIIKNLDIHDNIIKQPQGKLGVPRLIKVLGGSAERVKIHHNNFEKALFDQVMHWDAIGGNLDYANSTPTSKNHTEMLCSPSEYLVGTIITVKENGVPTPKICVKDGSAYGWRNISFVSVT